MTPSVSIIVPAYNPGEFLDQALESLLAQTYRDVEIIVIDDGSDIPCTTYSRYASAVTFYRQPHAGAAQARNTGFLKCRGDLLSFFDADDLCMPDKVMRQVNYLQENPSIGFVLSLISNFLEPGIEMPNWFVGESKLKERQGFVSSALVRRATFEKVGLFDARYQIGEDLEWLIRAQDLGIKSATIQEILLHRRIHKNNISANLQIGHANLMNILRESVSRRKCFGTDSSRPSQE